MMKRIVLAAVSSGILVGLLLTAMQLWVVTPMIIEAEVYESQLNVGDHAEPAGSWKPSDGFERSTFTALSNVCAGIGFSLLIVVGLLFHSGRAWWHGLVWGACGVAAFYFAPTLAYRPVLPGTLQSDVLVRQMWWLATVEGTIFGLVLTCTARKIPGRIAGLVVMLMPHVIGAPPGETVLFAPQALADKFFTVNSVTNTLFWMALGLFTVLIYGKLESRFRVPTVEEPRTPASDSHLSGVRSKYWSLDAAYRILGMVVVFTFFLGIFISHSHARLTHHNAAFLNRFGPTLDDIDKIMRLAARLATQSHPLDAQNDARELGDTVQASTTGITAALAWIAAVPALGTPAANEFASLTAALTGIAPRATHIIIESGVGFASTAPWYKLRRDLDDLQTRLVLARDWLVNAGQGYGNQALSQSNRLLVIEYALLLLFPLVAGGFIFYGDRLGQRINQQIAEQTRTLQLALANAKAEDDAKNDFLMRVNHNVRTPLTAIIGYCELILDGIRDQNTKLALDMNHVLSAARELYSLFDNAQSLAHIETGKVDGKAESIDVATLVREVAETVEPLMQRNTNRFSINVFPAVEQMVSNPDWVKKILGEVMKNAARFTHDGVVTVNVSLRREGDGGREREVVVFDVCDTGLGIQAERLSRIFEPFFQADTVNTRVRSGSGLGLAVCRGLCELLGGRIDVQSKFGRGSVFSIVLPRRPTGQPMASGMPSSAASAA